MPSRYSTSLFRRIRASGGSGHFLIPKLNCALRARRQHKSRNIPFYYEAIQRCLSLSFEIHLAVGQAPDPRSINIAYSILPHYLNADRAGVQLRGRAMRHLSTPWFAENIPSGFFHPGRQPESSRIRVWTRRSAANRGTPSGEPRSIKCARWRWRSLSSRRPSSERT